MATIVDFGYCWTLTDEAAQELVKNKVVYSCTSSHVDLLEIDKPIYHVSHDVRHGLNISAMDSHIKNAHNKTEKNNY